MRPRTRSTRLSCSCWSSWFRARRGSTHAGNGDARWVMQVVNHVIFAGPEHTTPQELQVDQLEQHGYGSESGAWRNFST
ncbi:alkyl sulfatase dimerization domain-containing protein [Streptomyces sp. NBUL23]|uniref:alkyl sulfatase dimerization domain-containing protein n=1 Tax=Streptomyces sp. NBUL23 TaxID=3381354 RepID=UPI003872880B